MEEISESLLEGYKREESITFSRTMHYLMPAAILCSFIYLFFKGGHYYIAMSLLALVTAHCIYKEIARKCMSCGKRCKIVNCKRVLNTPEYSKLHESFKFTEVTVCLTCKIYSEREHEPPSW